MKQLPGLSNFPFEKYSIFTLIEISSCNKQGNFKLFEALCPEASIQEF